VSARQVEVIVAAVGAGILFAFAAVYLALDAMIGEYDRRLVGSW
jgi:hypothetical protein